jgi:phage terminase large subunit-like protein
MTATLERPTTEAVQTRRVRTPDGREFLTAGQQYIDFIEAYCVHTKGKWRGKPFRLLPWQKRTTYELFEIDPETGLRRYRWAYIEVPKKQGKTEYIAALDVAMLCIERGDSPEIACAANSDDQADLVFGACKAMCEMSPDLAALTTCYAKEIVLKENPAAKIVRLSAAVGTNDGPSYAVVTLDELHEFTGEKGEGLFNVLTNATAAREQPLVLMITTAGHDPETVCGRFHEHALKVISGEVEDREFYAKVYAQPTDLDLHDEAAFEAAIRAANPSLGHTVQMAFYRDQRKRKTPGVFKRYFLNIWTETAEPWLAAGVWESCAGEPRFTPGAPTYVGIDASTKRDTTAIVAAQWHGDTLHVLSRAWERPLNPATGGPLEGWQVPIEAVKEELRRLHREHEATFAYDPAFITWVASELEAEGLRMVEFPQTNQRMVKPTQALYELITGQRLIHNGDPTFARHVRNVVAVQVSGGGQRLAKTKSRKAIDLAIALVMAVSEAGRPPEPAQAAPGMFFLDATGGG